jgi:SAM-dependent methyltransferase
MAVLTEWALLQTQNAFDSVAGEYDRSNAANPILSEMRRRVLAAVGAHVPRGSHILDLGCGPGADDEILGRAGYEVTAIDWSAAMVREARRRVDRADLGDRVRVHHIGIHQLDRLPPTFFDAAYSNFGPLNCVPDLGVAASQISGRVRRGGVLIASVIGRICPWEIGLYLSRADLARVRIRFASDLVAVPLNGGQVWTRYYTPSEFERTFAAAGFSRVSLHALGLFAPPPYLEAFAHRHPWFTKRLHRLDDLLGGLPAFRACGDHFLIVMTKE